MDNETPDQDMRTNLNKRFSRYNYVGVRNILKTDLEYKVALEQNEIVDMLPGDPMNEEQMSQTASGRFLPADGVTRGYKVIQDVIKAGEKKMLIGEAAYVLIPKIYNAYVREFYGTTKQALAKLRNPHIQNEILPKILIGPVINDVGKAIQTYVNQEMGKLEGFTDVQATPPKGFANPEILAKAQAARNAKKAAQPA